MAIPELSRRVFLRRSLQAAGALASLPLVEAACAPGAPEPGAGRPGQLSQSCLSRLDAVADAFVPAGGAFEAGARSVDLPRRIDAFLRDEDPAVVRGLETALLLVEYASGPLALRFGRFSAMSLEDRTACLAALPGSRIGLVRDVYAGLKQLCLFAFYATPESWTETGYDGPWVGREVGPA